MGRNGQAHLIRAQAASARKVRKERYGDRNAMESIESIDGRRKAGRGKKNTGVKATGVGRGTRLTTRTVEPGGV